MSSEQQLPNDRENYAKGPVAGEIKGTLKNLRTDKSYPFRATWIWRDEQQGTMRFHGQMDDPETPGKFVAIGIQFRSLVQQSGTYPVGDPAIMGLGYTQYGNEENNWKNVDFDAESGDVVLERAQFQKPINGRLVFKTATVGDDQYDIDVIYAIGGDF